MAAETPEIILFHYKESIFSHRVLWFLHLNGIKYSECIQPGWLPRPDITDGLHINYRRIPILAIGRDVYCDSRSILDVLEQRFAKNTAEVKDPADQGVRRLFESHCMHGGTFWRAATLLPMWRHPFLKDPRFIEDRSKMLGRPFDRNALMQARPEALTHMRIAFELMETTFLIDGRHWVLGNEKGPSRADIEAIYPLQWIVRDQLMEGGTPEEFINAQRFPRTFAWIDRFLATIKESEASAPPPTRISGEEAIRSILNATETTIEMHVDPDDPLALQENDLVTVAAADNAPTHSDTGQLLQLSIDGVCIRNDKNIRLHFPRWNFTIHKAAEDSQKSQLDEPQKPWIQPMKLIYHPMSPFSRKVFMFAIELGLDQNIELDQVVVAPIHYPGWSDNNDEVSQFNPVAKIPTLIPESHGDGIYDSQTIAEYLLEMADTYPSEPADNQHRWQIKTLQSLGTAVLDAHVLIIYENKIRAENNIKFDAWIDGQRTKINRALDRFEFEAERGTLRELKAHDIAMAGEIAVAVALAFSDIVKHEWRTSRPQLSAWFSKNWETRSSFMRTRPNVDWKTGKANTDEFAQSVVEGK